MEQIMNYADQEKRCIRMRNSLTHYIIIVHF